MRQNMIAGNWKMNGTSDSVKTLIEGVTAGLDAAQKSDVVVCAPYVYIPAVVAATANSAVSVGAQDVSEQDQGAYTGEVSGGMLKDVGCEYVIIGHSERRSLYGESDSDSAQKYIAAQRHGLTPIFCIGELLEERENGTTEAVCARQLDAVIEAAGVASLAKAVIAYEPVWAIGTGKVASPEQAQAVHAFIRNKLAALDPAIAEKVQILYGGSMNPSNVADLIAQPDIDGGLIGGASLKAEDFLALCQAAG